VTRSIPYHGSALVTLPPKNHTPILTKEDVAVGNIEII
jgi:hypothetical protein